MPTPAPLLHLAPVATVEDRVQRQGERAAAPAPEWSSPLTPSHQHHRPGADLSPGTQAEVGYIIEE